MIQVWRTNIQRWSRNRQLLLRTAAAIAIGGFLAALLIIAVAPPAPRFTVSPFELHLHAQWQKLQQAEEAQPYEMVRWLDLATRQIHSLAEENGFKASAWSDHEEEGQFAGFEIKPLLEKHGRDPAVIQLWKDFIRTALNPADTSLKTLEERAAAEPPLITANLIRAYLTRHQDPGTALSALMREARFFPQAELVKAAAFNLAVELEDRDALREIAAQPEWWSAQHAGMRQHAAALIGDLALQWQALLDYESFLDAAWSTVALALLAAAVWYVILVLHGVRGIWRWLSPLLPFTAGIFSVWPVFFIDSWQEIGLGMKEDSPFPYDLWYQIGGVGMREELSKLLLASFFMPWLLWKRAPGGAVMVGAFVGLGFAFEENINYYEGFGGGVPFTRFLSANFLHAALTGISTHALYDLLRTRLGSAERFLLTLGALVLAHGCYNYVQSIEQIQGSEIFALMILAMVAWHFLDLVTQECPPSPPRQMLTPAAVLLVGTALLMAAMFISLALLTPERQLLTRAAASCLSTLPVAFIYWRRMQI
ncbi:MAG TPA: PrsW family glutamic-type intramembrane protease [Prosthecobacter sp.]